MITGALGFVGRTLCVELEKCDYCVHRLARGLANPSGTEGLLTLGDIGPATDWANALENVDVIVHLAARVHILRERAANPLEEFRKVNVAGTERLARAAVASGVRRFVYLSSVGVNGFETAIGKAFSEIDKPNPHNAYSLSKWEAEQSLLRIADETGLEVVIIRSPLVYGCNAPGNFGTLMRASLHHWPLPLGAVHNQRSLVAVDNLVDFIITCISNLQAANQIFLVSDGRDVSTTELILGLRRAAGVPALLLPLPVWVLQAGAAFLGKRNAVQQLCGNLQVDISKARQLLGWIPPVSMDEGLRRAVVGYG